MDSSMMALTVVTVLCVIGSVQSASVATNISDTKHDIFLKQSHPPCDWSHQYLDTNMDPPSCRLCTVCKEGEYEIANCKQTSDRVCRYCPKGEVWSDLDASCWTCGCCQGEIYKHQVQNDCLAAGLPVHEACMSNGHVRCPVPAEAKEDLNNTTIPAGVKEDRNNTRVPAEVKDRNNTTVIVLCVVGAVVLAVVITIFVCKISSRCKRKTAKKLPIVNVIYKPARLPVAETRPDVRAEPTTVGRRVYPNPDLDVLDATQPFLPFPIQQQNNADV